MVQSLFGKVNLTYVSANMTATEHVLANDTVSHAVVAGCYCNSMTVMSAPHVLPCVVFKVRPFLWDKSQSAADLSTQWPA